MISVVNPEFFRGGTASCALALFRKYLNVRLQYLTLHSPGDDNDNIQV